MNNLIINIRCAIVVGAYYLLKAIAYVSLAIGGLATIGSEFIEEKPKVFVENFENTVLIAISLMGLIVLSAGFSSGY